MSLVRRLNQSTPTLSVLYPLLLLHGISAQPRETSHPRANEHRARLTSTVPGTLRMIEAPKR